MNLTVSRRLQGVAEIAEELGVSREWIWCVRTGKGKSARIEAALKAAGIKIRKTR